MDEVRKLVQEEGRSARNLLTYNVPLGNSQSLLQHDDSKLKRNVLNKRADKCPTLRKMRIRSASAGRNPKSELHARHWAFLFENLQRAVDEIYNTCETDESIIECKEVILILENFTKEFNALIDWINVKRDYEKSSVMCQRPPFLAWEIRKSSPIKHKERQSLNAGSSCKLGAARVLNFDDKTVTREMATVGIQANQMEISNRVNEINVESRKNLDLKIEENFVPVITNLKISEEIEESKIICEQKDEKMIDREREIDKSSWADKVRGGEIIKLEEKENQEDSEGWEIVQRNKFRVRNSPPHKVINKMVNDVKEKRKKDRAGSVPLENKKNCKTGNLYQCKEKEDSTVKSLPSLHLLKDENLEKVDMEKKLRKHVKYNEDESSPIDDELQSVIQEENDLNKQIEEAQKLDDEKPNSQDFDLHFIHQQSEERLGPQINQMTWGDRMDEIEADLRRPGHALHLHEKLSSPSRKRSLTESIRRHEEKQAKAQEQRERLLENKAQKLRDLAKKVEEVRSWKEELLMKKRDLMEKKLQNAEEKRKMQLQKIKKKAHDEEEKVNEIAFINTLEAQNKRHDVMSRIQGHEARMQDLHGERQRRQEEKAAKEAAAEERRRCLETERLARLAEMQERRRKKQDKIDKQHQEKEKERQEQAREKARDREERLSALAAAKQAEVEELQKKIQQKQEESARRHEENMEHIRQKALELSITRYSSSTDDAPRLVPYETKKLCTICNELIGSEVYLMTHLRGKKHQQMMKDENSGKEPSKEELEKYNLKYIINAPAGKTDPQEVEEKERQRNMKKKCKKLRQKLNIKGSEFEDKFQLDSVDVRCKLVKHLKDLLKCVQKNGALPSNALTSIERLLGEVGRNLEKKGDSEKILFRNAKGFQIIGQVWEALSRPASQPPNVKVFLALCHVMHVACENNINNCTFVLRNNRILNVIDALIVRLDILIPDDERGGGGDWTLASDALAAHLVHLVALVLDGNVSAPDEREKESWQTRVDDVLSYMVSVGVVDKVAEYLHRVHGPVDREQPFLLKCMELMTRITNLHLRRYRHLDVFSPKKTARECDSHLETHLESAFRATSLVNVVSLLYSILLHGGVPSRGSQSPPPRLSSSTINLARSGLRMLNHMALFHLSMFQSVLGDDALSLEFRHISTYLLWYYSASQSSSDDIMTLLLHELLLTVGYFTVLNPDHQTIIHSGHTPTLLQQLVTLPFPYFSDPRLTQILFPTLIACCHNNRTNKTIIQQEMSGQLLSDFLQKALQDDPATDACCWESDSDWRWKTHFRFPRSRWNEANDFFSSNN